jgi:hypothetical protein
MLVVSRFKDNNINHFLTLEIHAILREVAKIKKDEFVGLLLTWNDETVIPARWRLAFFQRLFPDKVFLRKEDVPWSKVVNAIEPPPYSWNSHIQGSCSRPIVDPFSFETPPIPVKDKELFRLMIGTVMQNAGISYTTETPIILFIVRRNNNRALLDSDTNRPLEDVFRENLAPCDAKRLVVTSFESMTFDEQVSLVARADTIVGAHGGALTNIVFARPGTDVFEISLRRIWMCQPMCERHAKGILTDETPCSPDKPAPYYHKADYRNLAKAFGLNYHEVVTDRGGSYFTNGNQLSVGHLYLALFHKKCPKTQHLL